LALVDKVGCALIKSVFSKRVNFANIPGIQQVFLPGSNVPLDFVVWFSDTQEAKASDEVYNILQTIPINTVYFIYFSDDELVVANLYGIPRIYESDISSCDASNRLPVFLTMAYLSEYLHVDKEVYQVLDACARPTKVVNPCNKSEYVKIQPETFFEYSGSKGTTCYNNCASLAIALGLYEELQNFTKKIDFGTLISKGAARYGWVVTVERRESFNSGTFLKRAFNGKRSWKVFGCILRSFGLVDGELRADQFGLSYSQFKKMTNIELTDILVRMLYDSLSNEPVSLLTNALAERCKVAKRPLELQLTDLQERYGGEESEWCELELAIATVQFGDQIRLPILEKIYGVDYGVQPYDYTQGVIRTPDPMCEVF
jgi:hypothetical protein